MEDKKPEAVVYKPDLSLKRKIGNVDLSKIIDSDVIRKVEQVMENSSDKILDEVFNEVSSIRDNIYLMKKKGELSADCKNKLVKSAFSVKSIAGLCSYPLVSALAKSLYLFCETRKDDAKLTKQEIDIISWHDNAISAILAKQLKEDNNEFGKGLLIELEKIKSTFIK